MKISQLNTEKKIGLLLMVGVNGHHPDKIVQKRMENNYISAFILFQKNTPTPDVTNILTYELNQMAQQFCLPKLLIAIDQEHGRVIRIRNGVTRFPAAYGLGCLNNQQYVYDASYISGCELRSLGININFAPVADINSNPENPIIGTRSFGEKPILVAEMVRKAVKGYQNAGILCSAKHFPGHGDVAIDSHIDLPVCEKSIEELTQMELLPFKSAILESVPMIMTAHILYPKIDPKCPATFSPIILTQMLRNQLNYQGVIISDDLEMKALTRYGNHAELAIQMINAGCDMLIISENLTRDVSVDAVYHALVEAVNMNIISEKRLNESAQRVLDLRKKISTNTDEIPDIRSSEHLSISHRMMRDVFMNNHHSDHFPVHVYPEQCIILSDVEELLHICPDIQINLLLITKETTPEEIIAQLNGKKEIFIFLSRTFYLSTFQEIKWATHHHIRFFSLNNPYIQTKINIPFTSYINLYADCLPVEILSELIFHFNDESQLNQKEML